MRSSNGTLSLRLGHHPALPLPFQLDLSEMQPSDLRTPQNADTPLGGRGETKPYYGIVNFVSGGPLTRQNGKGTLILI